MDDNTGQTSTWNVKEHWWKDVNGEKDNNAGDHSCERSAHSSFRLDCCAREGSSCRIASKEWTEDVGDTNCHKLL